MKNEITKFLNEYFIFKYYKISFFNGEYLVNIDGDLIVKSSFVKIPKNMFRFNSVHGSVYIENTNIESMYGFPNVVYKNYIIENNKNLKSINVMPESILGKLYIKNNENLESIYNIPTFISKILNIYNNSKLQLLVLINSTYIGGNFILKHNNKNLKIIGYSKQILGKTYTSFANKLKLLFNKIINF